MANFTTENNTYCFRIGPAFLDTSIFLSYPPKSYWFSNNRRLKFIFFKCIENKSCYEPIYQILI